MRPFLFAIFIGCAAGPAVAQENSFAQARLSSSSSLAGDAQSLLGLSEPAGGRQPLTLDDALARVAGAAPDVKIALERAAQQDAQLRRAWALVLPTLSAGAAYTHNCTAGGLTDDAGFAVDCADRTTQLVNPDTIDQQATLFESLSQVFNIAADAAANEEDAAGFREQAGRLDDAAKQIRDTDTTPIVTQPASQLTGQLSFTLPLLNPRAYPALLNAYDGVDAAALAQRQAKQGLAFSVVRAYYAAYTAQRLVDASTKQVEVSTKQRDAVRARVEANTQPALSLKRAELELLRAKQGLASAKAAADNAVAVVGSALGVTEMFTLVAPPAVAAVDVSAVGGTEAALVDHALQARLEVRTQKIALQIAQRQTLDGWMQFLPQVGLTATARATSFTSGFVRDPVTGTLILSATLPLYDGGLRYATLDEASSRTSEESVRLHQLEDRVAAQVRGNLRDVVVREEALALAQQALTVSQEAQQQAQALFDAGVGTALDVSETSFAVFVAESDALRAEFDVATARLGLRWALGDALYERRP